MRAREFRGEAAEDSAASLEDAFALVSAVDRYPDWCPDIVREVEVIERRADGQPSRVRMRMHISRAGISREFDLLLAVAAQPPGTVTLTRFTDHSTNQEFNATWRLDHGGSTHVALELDAKLRVPWYVPDHGLADALAAGFVSAACRALTQQDPH